MKQLRMVQATLRYAAFTETDQEALDFIHQAAEDWPFPDDRAEVTMVTSLDSRVMPLPVSDLVYHDGMDDELTIAGAFEKSPKPKSLAPAPEEQRQLPF